MARKRKKGWGDSTLGSGGRIGKTRSRPRSINATPKPSRKWGRAGRGMGSNKSKLARGRRHRKLSSLVRGNSGNVFKSRLGGRRLGNIFKGRKSSGKGLTNIFKKAKLERGLGAGARPSKGMGAFSGGKGPRFSGGIFSSVLGKVSGKGKGWGLSLNSDLSGLVEPTATLEIKVIVAIHSYLRARVRSATGKQQAKALRETFKAAPSLSSGVGLLARSRWQKYDAGAVRQARQRLYEVLDSTAAKYILDVLNSRRPTPDTDNMAEHGLGRFSPRLLRVIIEAQAILYDDSLSASRKDRIDAATEGGFASMEAGFIDETVTGYDDLIREYVGGRLDGDSRTYTKARKRLRDRMGKILADRVLRWTTGETAVPGNLNRIRGLEDTPPQLREAIIEGRGILSDLQETRGRIDDAAEEDEARREYEGFLETL